MARQTLRACVWWTVLVSLTLANTAPKLYWLSTKTEGRGMRAVCRPLEAGDIQRFEDKLHKWANQTSASPEEMTVRRNTFTERLRPCDKPTSHEHPSPPPSPPPTIPPPAPPLASQWQCIPDITHRSLLPEELRVPDSCSPEFQRTHPWAFQPYITKHRGKVVGAAAQTTWKDGDAPEPALAVRHLANLLSGKRVLVLGDSMMRQMYDAIRCEAQRSRVLGDEVDEHTTAEMSEFGATLPLALLAHGQRPTAKLFYLHMQRLDKAVIDAVLATSIDVLVFNFGLHYTDKPEYLSLKQDLRWLNARLIAWADAALLAGRRRHAFFRETSAEHFNSKSNSGGCECSNINPDRHGSSNLSKLPKLPSNERNKVASLMLTGQWHPDKHGNAQFNKAPPGRNATLASLRAKPIPFFKGSLQLFNQHHERRFEPGACDCVHLCYFPHFWQRALHDLYRGLRKQGVCDTAVTNATAAALSDDPEVLGTNHGLPQRKTLDEIPPKCILIAGFPHSGTSILKSILGHVEAVRTEPGEFTERFPPRSANCGCRDGRTVVFKSPFFHEYFLGSAFDDVHKVLIIRHPLQVFDSMNKRFAAQPRPDKQRAQRCHAQPNQTVICHDKEQLPAKHTIHDWLSYHAEWTWLHEHKAARTDVSTIRYEDMFESNFELLREMFAQLGLDTQGGRVFENEHYSNEANNIYFIKSGSDDEPTRHNHKDYRAWQVNQPFKNRNRPLAQLVLEPAQREALESVPYP